MAQNNIDQDKLLQMVLKNPEKHELILQALLKDKNILKHVNPLNKLVNTKKQELTKVCESPTALFRRRALEQQNRNNGETSSSDSETVKSRKKPTVLFEKLLKGVIAFVEVRSKDQDRSAGAKALMRTMGATIRDTFTNDVTHVIFKDGSYTTYQKAKLMKIHLVSILWLEALNRTKTRVSEKDYPAFGTESYDQNVSVLCSQMQKEYEDVIREEVRRSISSGIPLPSTKLFIEKKRRTVLPQMTSSDSYHTAVKDPSNLIEDDGKSSIISNDKNTTESNLSGVLNIQSPEITSDDSDCGLINGESSGRLKRITSVNIKTDNNNTESERNSISFGSKSLISFANRKNVKNASVMDLTCISNSIQEEQAKKCNEYNSDSSASKKSTNISTNIISNKAPFSTNINNSSDYSTNIDVEMSKKSKIYSPVGTSDKENTSASVTPNLFSSSTNINSVDLSDKNGKNDKSHLQNDSENTNSKEENEDTGNKINNRKSMSNSTITMTDSTSSYLLQELEDTETFESSDKSKSLDKVSNKIKPNYKQTRISNRKSVVNSSSDNILSNLPEELEDTETFIDSDKGQNSEIKVHDEKVTVRKVNNKNAIEVSNKSTFNSQQLSRNNNKKFRKLYNPDESVDKNLFLSDNEERQENRLKKKKTPPNNIATLPASYISLTPIIITNKAKEILDNCLNELPTVSEIEKSKTEQNKKRKKSIELNENFDSDVDEQKELRTAIIDKKNIRTRRTTRAEAVNCRLTPKTPNVRASAIKARRSVRVSLFEDKTPETDSDDLLPIPPLINRRSTLEFQSPSSQANKRKLKINQVKNPTIVCTKMHKSEVQVFMQIVTKLGKFKVEDEVGKKTTHLVVGESKRTINMLRAIARGCWILQREWLYKSLEEGKWLAEEDYEVKDFSDAVQECRLQRIAFGSSYSMDIFQSCDLIYVALSSNPRCSDLRELITLCKGQITKIIKKAKIVVGEYYRQDGVTCVTETWVLDSITYNKKQNLKKYIITPREKTSPFV